MHSNRRIVANDTVKHTRRSGRTPVRWGWLVLVLSVGAGVAGCRTPPAQRPPFHAPAHTAPLKLFRFDYPHVTVFCADPLTAEEVARETLPLARRAERACGDCVRLPLIVFPLDRPLPVSPFDVLAVLEHIAPDVAEDMDQLAAGLLLAAPLPEDVALRIPLAVSIVPLFTAMFDEGTLELSPGDPGVLVPYATGTQIRELHRRGCDALARRGSNLLQVARLTGPQPWIDVRDEFVERWWSQLRPHTDADPR